MSKAFKKAMLNMPVSSTCRSRRGSFSGGCILSSCTVAHQQFADRTSALTRDVAAFLMTFKTPARHSSSKRIRAHHIYPPLSDSRKLSMSADDVASMLPQNCTSNKSTAV
eukprot:5815181-Amphidinium_carterae.1